MCERPRKTDRVSDKSKTSFFTAKHSIRNPHRLTAIPLCRNHKSFNLCVCVCCVSVHPCLNAPLNIHNRKYYKDRDWKEGRKRENKRSREHSNCHTHTHTVPLQHIKDAYLLMCALNYRQEYKAYPKRQSIGVKMDVERGEKREIFQSTFRREAVVNQMVRCSHAEYRSETACVLKYKDTLILSIPCVSPSWSGLVVLVTWKPARPA